MVDERQAYYRSKLAEVHLRMNLARDVDELQSCEAKASFYLSKLEKLGMKYDTDERRFDNPGC